MVRRKRTIRPVHPAANPEMGKTPLQDVNYHLVRQGIRRKEASMAREGSFILDTGDTFPAIGMETVAHGRLMLPDAFDGNWGVFLVYRAHW
jgi:hypothetical protein